jgi:hypothetical protein
MSPSLEFANTSSFMLKCKKSVDAKLVLISKVLPPNFISSRQRFSRVVSYEVDEFTAHLSIEPKWKHVETFLDAVRMGRGNPGFAMHPSVIRLGEHQHVCLA